MKKFLLLLALLAFISTAQAANVNLTADDGFGASSLNSSGSWSDGSAPSAGNDYFTDNYRLRTPPDGGAYTFAGDSLTVGDSYTSTNDYRYGLTFKGTGSGGSITINNLILDGGTINTLNGTGDVMNLYGNISVIADSYIYALQGPLNVYAPISGDATITNPGSGGDACVLTFYSGYSTFTGDIVNEGRFELAEPNAVLNFAIGENGVNNSVSGAGAMTAFNAEFNIDLTAASANVGDSWSIVTATNTSYGDTFYVADFDDLGGGIWQKIVDEVIYRFEESTGVLEVYVAELDAEPISGIEYRAEYNVLNGDLTQPGVNVNPGWDGETGTDIPGWTAVTTGTLDGGIGGGGTGASADGDGWHASVGYTDPAIYNMTSTTMVEGATYTFTGQFAPRWGLITGEMSIIADGDLSTFLATTTVTFPEGIDHSDSFYPATVSYTATAADAGKNIGIYLNAASISDGVTNAWMRFDDIHLYSGYQDRHGVIDHAPEIADPSEPFVLSWTPTNDPNLGELYSDDQILYYYIGDGDGTELDVASYVNVSGISKGTSATSHTVTEGIGYDQYCMWRVDTVLEGETYTGETVVTTSLTADNVPVITSGGNWVTWLAEPVTLTAVIDDSGEGDVADADNVWSITGSATPWEAAMQMKDYSGNENLTTLEGLGYDRGLFEDWIGTDARGVLNIVEPLTIVLSGVPAGTYTWISYHHDVVDQTGSFDVTVIDSTGTTEFTGLDITAGAEEPVSEFAATVTSDGGDIVLQFDCTGTENNTSFFVMNGFVLSDGVNPDLAVDFGTPTNSIGAGFQAYTADHEIESSFTSQTFSALGSSVAVTPSWGTESYYVSLVDASSDALAPAVVFESNWPADFTVQLDSTDRGGSIGDQAAEPVQMTVRIAENACAAAVLSGVQYNYYDANNDCFVDLSDFAVFAGEWLSDATLTGPVSY